MSELFQDRKIDTGGVAREVPEDSAAPLFEDENVDRLAELLFSDDQVFATYLHFLPNSPTRVPLEAIDEILRTGPRRLAPLAVRHLLVNDPDALVMLRERLHHLATKLSPPWVEEMVKLVAKDSLPPAPASSNQQPGQ